ncbi:hypothetical protein AQ616_11095 [Oceanobacillus sp. E9]|uniref:cell wall-active antibiotics response protein LiaF n=1 Tax=Oceanobacillus sp. E9 TaxID=1742575 RepID=UPI00084E4923|nr:cell wall-active antibiotics response protein LiaF [Oceanobacillus sp. E9]OEH54299.1 hypothetical protein AQ616_11095 [Oceanobacillus sp. E9]
MRFLKYLFAMILIAFGMLLVLNNIGVYDFQLGSSWGYIYPSFFIVYGLFSLWNYLRKKGGGWMFSSFLIIFGTLLLLDRFQYISFGFWDVFQLWPLFIVYIGVSIINSKQEGWRQYSKGTTYSKGNSHFSIGDYQQKQEWNLEPLNLRNLAGDFYLDLTKAYIPDKTTPISIRSLAGDVTVLLPEHIDFRIDAAINAGEIIVLNDIADGINRNINYESENYPNASKKVDLFIRLKAGSIRVERI